MIDIVQKFGSLEKKITELLIGQKADYFGDKVYTNLKNRISVLDKSNNLDFGQDRFMSKLGFPIQKTQSLMRGFIFDTNYRSEQLFYVKETESTDTQTAHNIEDTLLDNLRRTKFKSKAFNEAKRYCAEYGTAVTYSFPGVLYQPHYRTSAIRDSYGRAVEILREFVDTPDIVIFTKNVPILNYFQDPSCSDCDDSNYIGHIERWNVNELINYYKTNKDVFVKSNILSVITKIKKEGWIDSRYQSADGTENISKRAVDITKIFSTLNIAGNEENTIPYYIEMIDDKIIRIEQHIYDENLRPYSVLKFIPRKGTWWGNTDSEFRLSHENAVNTLIGLKMDNAIRAEDQLLFVPKNKIDVDSYNSRRYNGGIVELDLPDGANMNNMIAKFQSTDSAISTFDSMMREVNSSMQGIGSQPNVNSRVSKTGPLANTTARAVGAMEDISDVKESSYLEQFNYGVIQIGRNNVVLLKQFLPNDFAVVSSPGKQERYLNKDEILGSADISVRTALTNNKVYEAQRYINALNQIMNLRGTQDPDLLAIQLKPIIKNWLHRLDIGDINDIYAEQQPQQIPQQQGVEDVA